MLLTIQQRYILDLLRKVGCLRSSQIHLLLKQNLIPPDSNYVLSSERVTRMLQQLRHCVGEVRLDGDIIHLATVNPTPLLLEAVDVMLELTDGQPQDIQANQALPTLLRFSLQDEHLRLFTIAHLSDAHIPLLNNVQRHQAERVVWISDNGTAPKQLTLPAKHFFAVRQEDGSHRFYGGEGS